MKISAFKIGLVLVIIGMVWVSVIFNETEKNHEDTLLKKSSSIESKLEFTGADIGYYKIYMPEFNDESVFVQILDKNLNVIQEQKVNTKFSVAYFDFSRDGVYTIKVSNISENSINVQIEFDFFNNVSSWFFSVSLKITATQIIPIITNTNPILNADIFILFCDKLLD